MTILKTAARETTFVTAPPSNLTRMVMSGADHAKLESERGTKNMFQEFTEVKGSA